jgi:hypothetical protein
VEDISELAAKRRIGVIARRRVAGKTAYAKRRSSDAGMG